MDQKSPAAVLGVFPEAHDRALLRNILSGSEFDLCLAETFEQMKSLIQRKRFDLIVTEGRLSGNCSWRHLRDAVRQTGDTPVIVADRLADERLWAEVLNMGCVDLLSKPLDPAQALRVIGQAARVARRGNPGGHHGGRPEPAVRHSVRTREGARAKRATG